MPMIMSRTDLSSQLAEANSASEPWTNSSCTSGINGSASNRRTSPYRTTFVKRAAASANALNSLLLVANSCKRFRANSTDDNKPHSTELSTISAASSIVLHSSSSILILYAVASSTVSQGGLLQPRRSQLPGSTGWSIFQPKWPDLVDAHLLDKWNLKDAQPMKEGRAEQIQKGRLFDLTRRFSRRSRSRASPRWCDTSPV